MWAAVGLAFLAVAALGLVGFDRYQQSHGGSDPASTSVYKTLQLFVLESGAVDGQAPWQLQIARIAAPLVAAYALVQTLAAVFREQVEFLRLRLVRNHVVIAGLGRKGTQLAHALLHRGDRVVVIEADPSNVDLETIRAIGGLAVVGDARDPATQQRARVSRASHLVALCGDDGTNIEVTARAREHALDSHAGTLRCVADLADPALCLLLSIDELERYGQTVVRADFVNTYAGAMQALLRAHPPFRADDGAVPWVLVIGAGLTARHLLTALARAWAIQTGSDDQRRLKLTVVGLDEQSLSELGKDHAELTRFAAVQAVDEPWAALATGTPGVIFVCPDDDASATATALDLRAALTGRPALIVIVLQKSSGLGRLLRGAPHPTGGPAMATFSMVDEACTPEVLLTGTTELIAQALHGVYLDSHAGAGTTDEPSLQSWSELPPTLRASNRDQAAHIAVKLATIGRTVGPLIDWDSALDAFSEVEVEIMARLEHDRWVSERQRAGWRPGPRDPAKLTTPYLVPWGELSEEIRDVDRLFVRQIPRVLALVGLQAVRTDGPVRPPRSSRRMDAAG